MMTTSISIEAVWKYKKYEGTTENLNGDREIAFPYFFIVLHVFEECAQKKLVSQLGAEKIAYLYLTFLPFVA